MQRTENFVNIVINDAQVPGKIKSLVEDFPGITSPHANENSAYCGVYHRINTESIPPVFAKARQLSQDKYQSAHKEFRKLLSKGIISQSDSEWSSPCI